MTTKEPEMTQNGLIPQPLSPFKKGRDPIYVVGAGLAGSECAWQLAELGHKVLLVEMRGTHTTPAHKTADFAELVCSNSLGSQTDYSAPGQLKWEAERLGSLILKSAREAYIPAGMALGVDRVLFAQAITQAISSHPNIQVERKRVESLSDIPRPAVIATGPLTSENLARSIGEHLSQCPDEPNSVSSKHKNEFLYFFDAIAPIIDVDSINMDIAWKANRNNKSSDGETTVISDEGADGDYINCPLDKDQYFRLMEAITAARKVEPKEFEKDTPYFEGCMPIEAMVERGPLTPRFGPMSPNGLTNPKTGLKPYAVVQLRQENKDGTAYGMVGFQTKMAYGEQKNIFSMIPGLDNAEFLKLGSIHRNMYIHSPRKLTVSLSSKLDPWLFFAGQITGVEGYFDSTCIGLLVARLIEGQMTGIEASASLPPRETALGSLHNGITEPKKYFQPTNINFGLFPRAEDTSSNRKEGRIKNREEQLRRAKSAFLSWHQSSTTRTE